MIYIISYFVIGIIIAVISRTSFGLSLDMEEIHPMAFILVWPIVVIFGGVSLLFEYMPTWFDSLAAFMDELLISLKEKIEEELRKVTKNSDEDDEDRPI